MTQIIDQLNTKDLIAYTLSIFNNDNIYKLIIINWYQALSRKTRNQPILIITRNFVELYYYYDLSISIEYRFLY